MKETKAKCYAELKDCKDVIKHIAGVTWNPNTPTNMIRWQRLTMQERLEELDSKTLNSLQIIMTAGRDCLNKRFPFTNPKKEFEEYAKYLHLSESDKANRDLQIDYILGKIPLKTYLEKGLFMFGVA